MFVQNPDSSTTQAQKILLRAENDSTIEEISVVLKDTVQINDPTPFYQDWSFYLLIVSVLIAVMALLIPNFIYKRLEKKKENDRLIQLKEYYLSLAKSYLRPLNELIDIITDVADKIKAHIHENIHIKGVQGLYLGQITNILHQDLYMIFIQMCDNENKLKYEHFKNLINSFEDIQATKKSVKEQFYEFSEKANMFTKIWSENINKIGRFFDSEIQQIRANASNLENDPFFYEMDLIRAKWQKMVDYQNIYIAVENYIYPINSLCTKYQSDPRSITILPFIVNCIRAFKDYRNIKDFYSSIFTDMAGDLKSDMKKIEDAITFFETKNKKQNHEQLSKPDAAF